jgi:hypothetical protein
MQVTVLVQTTPWGEEGEKAVTLQNPIPVDVVGLVKEALYVLRNLETEDARIEAALAVAESELNGVIEINVNDPIDDAVSFARTASKRDHLLKSNLVAFPLSATPELRMKMFPGKVLMFPSASPQLC